MAGKRTSDKSYKADAHRVFGQGLAGAKLRAVPASTLALLVLSNG